MGVETTLRTSNRPATPAMTDDSSLTFFLPAVCRKKVTAAFDGGRLSSDSGVILLSLAERRRAIARTLAALIDDPRDPAHITHTVEDVLRARVLAIACGYPDGNDFHFLRSDPAFKLACGRLPETGADLCSQPTISRWENAPTLREIIRLTYALIDIWCGSYKAPPRSVVLDIDDTLDVAHGRQEMAEWNAHYDERCFLPIHIYDTATGRPVAMILRPGKTPSGAEVRRWLRRLVKRIRRHWPVTRVTIRGDGHYGRDEAMNWCEDNGVDYIFGFGGNAVLDRLVEEEADDIRTRRAEGKRAILRGYAETRYAAKSWTRERRVAARIEAKESDEDDMLRRGLDVRYVVTSLNSGSAEHIYAAVYCARGQAENLIKQHKAQTASDRTSCRSPLANQFRLILHTAAYWLLLDVRDHVPSWHPLRQSEFSSIRLHLLKVAGRIVETASRIRVALASCCPEAALFGLVAFRLQQSGP
jgi:Transposase DDE domain group 1